MKYGTYRKTNVVTLKQKRKKLEKKIKLKNNKAKKVFVKFNTTAGSELPAQ